jgi:hypothetical protein
MNKNTKALLYASKEAGLEIHTEKTSMFLSPRQNSRQNPIINTGNRFFENVTKLKYLGMTITN